MPQMRVMAEIIQFNIRGEKLKKKLFIIIGCLILITPVFSFNVYAGDPENPEIEDRMRDVKLFGLFPFLPQSNLKYADIISAWIYGEESNPDYLYISLKIMDIEDTTEKYDAI